MTPQGSERILVVLLIVFLGLTLLLISGFHAPVILGALLATLTFPLYNKLRIFFRDQKNLAALVTIFVIVVGIILPFIGITTLLGSEAFNLFLSTKDNIALDQNLADKLEIASQKLNLNVNVENFIQEQVAPWLKSFSLSIYQKTGTLLSGVFSLLVSFFIMLFTIFYLLRDGDLFGKFFLNLQLFKNNEGAHLFRTFRETGKAIIYGIFLTALAQGILAGFGFYIFGLETPVLWGAVMAFLSLIPLLGPYIIYIPATIYLLTIKSPALALGFFFYNFLIVSTIDNIIRPKIIANKIDAHPLFIFIAILGGLKIFGILGVIYGPLIAAIFLVLLETYRLHQQREIQGAA